MGYSTRVASFLVVAVFALFGAAVPATTAWAVQPPVGDDGVRWTYAAGGAVGDPAAVDGGLAFVASGDGALVALDLATGEERWRASAGEGFPTAPVVADGAIYVANGDGTLRAFDASDGTERWRVDAISGRSGSVPATDGNLVFLTQPPVEPGGQAILHALDAATGAARWRADLGVGLYHGPVVAGGRVYAAGNDGDADDPTRLRAFDAATGREATGTSLDGLVWPVGATEELLYAAGDEGLHALDAATGEERWQVPAATAAERAAVTTEAIFVGQIPVKGDQPPADEPPCCAVRALDPTSGEERWATTVPLDDHGVVAGLTYLGPSSNGEAVAFVDAERRALVLLDAEDGTTLRDSVPLAAPVLSLTAVPGGFLLGGQDGSVVVVDAGGATARSVVGGSSPPPGSPPPTPS